VTKRTTADLQEWLADMRHELCTPLNVVIGYSEMLIDDARDDGDEQLVNDADRIRTAGHQLLGMLNEIIDLAKTRIGEMGLDVGEFELGPLLEFSVERVKSGAPGGWSVDLQTPDGGLMISTDQNKLMFVVVTALSGLAKASDGGATTLKTHRESGNLVIELSGSCVAPPAHTGATFFEALVDPAVGDVWTAGAVGLGWALASDYCKLLGGSITLSERANHHVGFEITVPIGV